MDEIKLNESSTILRDENKLKISRKFTFTCKLHQTSKLDPFSYACGNYFAHILDYCCLKWKFMLFIDGILPEVSGNWWRSKGHSVQMRSQKWLCITIDGDTSMKPPKGNSE